MDWMNWFSRWFGSSSSSGKDPINNKWVPHSRETAKVNWQMIEGSYMELRSGKEQRITEMYTEIKESSFIEFNHSFTIEGKKLKETEQFFKLKSSKGDELTITHREYGMYGDRTKLLIKLVKKKGKDTEDSIRLSFGAEMLESKISLVQTLKEQIAKLKIEVQEVYDEYQEFLRRPR